jgi:gamma-glutamylcyclotransferase (GGCT)/AIG2-like uncharacterized protein YtfP
VSVNIFTYGSLMFSPVWDRIVAGNYLASSAELHGYARRAVMDEDYPVAFAARPEDSINGIVYYDVEPDDVRRLDLFEGDYYQRVSVDLELPQLGTITADVYVVRQSYQRIISDQLWDPVDFQQNALSKFLADYDGFFFEG